MAEIKIEKKKPVWPWIILILIILGIIAYWVYNNNYNKDYENDDANIEQKDTINNNYLGNPQDAETNQYDDGSTAMMELMTALKDSSRFGTDSIFTKTALINLAKITVAKAKAFSLTNSTSFTELEHFVATNVSDMNGNQGTDNMEMSKNFESVSDQIVTVIQDIQAKSFPNMQKQISDLKSTVSKLDGAVDLSKQQTNVQSFFRQAHGLLHNMNS